MRHALVEQKDREQTDVWKWSVIPIGAVVLLLGSFLYVWLRVEPVFEYHTYGPYFYSHRPFFNGFVGRPGGLVNYAGVYLAQFNSVSVLGALVFVIIQGLVLLAAALCLRRISGSAAGIGALVPPFLLLVMRNRYGSPVTTAGLGVLLAWGGFASFAPWGRSGWAVLLTGLISGVLFYLGGAWSAVLFVVLCSLFVWFQLHGRTLALACLALGLGVPIAIIGAGWLNPVHVLNPWGERGSLVLAGLLYAWVPLASAAALCQRDFRLGGSSVAASSQAERAKVMSPEPWLQSRIPGEAVAIAALLLGWAVLGLTFDQREKRLAEIDYYSTHRQDEAVLAAARHVKALNHPAFIRVQLALYKTGRLASELFSFHNMIEDVPTQGIGEDWRAQSHTLFELGLVNDAEHDAHEALELEGARPDLLRLLARINLLKNRPEAAQVFLNVLSLIPFQRERPNAGWPTAEVAVSDAERMYLSGIYRRMLTNEVPHSGLPVGALLDTVLESNATNQMAFEYAMASDLLDLNLKKAVERLRLLDNFHYSGIPRSYEEALLLDGQVERRPVALKRHEIRPETVARFRRFKDAVRTFRGTRDEQTALAADFGDTYWYYYAARSLQRAAK